MGWGFTRKAYEEIGGLYEYSIVGGGDAMMGSLFINNPPKDKM